jgi:hypothetical protein
MSSKEPNVIVIRKNFRVGELEAETDIDLLDACFFDKGDLEVLSDVSNPACIILGRTGSGKSAMLYRLSKTVAKSKTLNPHDISINFLEYSNIVQFFNELGVNIDMFYRLLWRHILTIELLKLRYEIRSKSESEGIIDRLFGFAARDHVKKEALSYFNEWGDKFWLDTHEQLKQVTEKLERDIKASFSTSGTPVDITLSGAKSMSSEARSEFVSRASRVVSQIQIKKLSDVLDLLEDKVFDDNQKKYFIQIDRLDESWANTETRYRFIRALIEEIKVFRRIKNVKIIVAMRKDLMDMVFDKTRDSGFQQEKYESYIFPLVWGKNELKALIERRINEIYKRQYTKSGITFDDVFAPPKKGGNQTAIDYIIERTFLRPRDVMQFVNECLRVSENYNRVSWRQIYAAESNYSQKRLKSLYEEWSEVYPALERSMELLRGVPASLERKDLAGPRLHVVEAALMDGSEDPCSKAVVQYCEPGARGLTEAALVSEFIACFYRIGALGVKLSGVDTHIWSDHDKATLSKGDIERANLMKVHKMLYRALGIVTHEHQYQEN